MPTRKPTALKVLGGTNRRDRQKNEPKPRPVAPKKPGWLKGRAAKAWKEFSPELERLGLLTTVDGPSFAMLCVHFSLAAESYERIQAEGLLSIDEHGCQRKNPMLQVLRDQSAAFKTYAAQFGLTPASRGTIDLPQKGEADEFEAYLKRGRALGRG